MSMTKRKNASSTVPGPGAGRNFDDRRPVGLQVEEHQAVDGVRIAGEQQRIRIDQLIEDDGLVALGRADSTLPRRSASIEAAGMKLRNTSTPRRKSRLSYTFCVVSAVGTPSTKLSVPIRV